MEFSVPSESNTHKVEEIEFVPGDLIKPNISRMFALGSDVPPIAGIEFVYGHDVIKEERG